MKTVTDQLGRRIQIKDVPSRIVSLVPSQTELLVDLGLKERLVGITKFCVHPEDLRKEKKVVGGTKQVHYDRIAALAPDVILCNKEENTRDMVLELEQIAPVHVSDVRDIPGALELIDCYGNIFNVGKRAAQINGLIREKLEGFQRVISGSPRRKVAYLIWKRPWMAAGKDNFIDYLLKLNNFDNVFGEEDSRYPEIVLDQLREKEVELLLLSTEPYPFKDEHRNDLQEKLKEVEVEIVDGEFFSWYGSRLIQAFEYFKQFHRSLRHS